MELFCAQTALELAAALGFEVMDTIENNIKSPASDFRFITNPCGDVSPNHVTLKNGKVCQEHYFAGMCPEIVCNRNVIHPDDERAIGDCRCAIQGDEGPAAVPKLSNQEKSSLMTEQSPYSLTDLVQKVTASRRPISADLDAEKFNKQLSKYPAGVLTNQTFEDDEFPGKIRGLFTRIIGFREHSLYDLDTILLQHLHGNRTRGGWKNDQVFWIRLHRTPTTIHISFL